MFVCVLSVCVCVCVCGWVGVGAFVCMLGIKMLAVMC